MVGPPNNHDLNTKSSTNDYCETGRGAFENCDNCFTITWKNAVFGQGKMVYFYVESGKNYRFSTLLSGKKGCFLTKSQGKLFLRTAGNPVGADSPRD